jgi:hypothetical protein
MIIRNGHRAGEVIRRVRALSKKTDPQMAPLDINDVVNEVIALVQREVFSHRVSLRMESHRARACDLGSIQRKFGKLYELFEPLRVRVLSATVFSPCTLGKAIDCAVRQDQCIIRRDTRLLGCGLGDTPPSATLNLLAR